MSYNKDTAECQFTESNGNKGNVKLVFKTNEIEATIKYTHKLEIFDYLSLDGNFLFEPYNLKAINRFSPIKDQCFTVDLNSWGNVNFVSGKVSGEKRIVNVFFLTNDDGDILYDLGTPFPYGVNVKVVSFQDVNKDGLKDIIIIINEDSEDSTHMVGVFLQNSDGSFVLDGYLNQEINDSGKNKDIQSVMEYLYEKY